MFILHGFTIILVLGGITMRFGFSKLVLLALVFSFLTLSLWSCGGGGGGGNNSSIITQIKSDNQSKSVASAAVNTIEDMFYIYRTYGNNTTYIRRMNSEVIKHNAGFFWKNIGNKLLQSFKLIPKVKTVLRSVPINETLDCNYSGNVTYSGNYDNTTNYINITLTFNNCNEDNKYIDDGVVLMKGTYNSDTDLNVTFTFKNYSDNAINESDNTSINGVLGYKVANEAAILSFNGSTTESWVNSGVAFSMSEKTNNFESTYTTTDIGCNVTVSGIISYNFTPETYCSSLNGTYELKSIIPTQYDKARDICVVGDLNINDNTKVLWNQDGTVDVYYNNNPVYSGDESGLYDICYLPSD